MQVMKKFAFRDWCLEQRFMALLLPLILLYNNPLFPLNFLTSSWLPGTLDGFFQVCESGQRCYNLYALVNLFNANDFMALFAHFSGDIFVFSTAILDLPLPRNSR